MNFEIKKIDVPYPLPPAIDESKREEFMAWNSKQGYPKIKFGPTQSGVIQIIGYGPSLKDSWKEIDPRSPLITMSGSLKFLLEKGLKPLYGAWFHADVDPRPHKADLIALHKDVIYLMGSVSHPKTLKKLDGYKVVLWHGMSGPHTKQWVAENDPGQVLVAAGSTIGLSAIHLGGVFGYHRFEIHGMDGSFNGEERHAGIHTGQKQGQRPSKINPDFMTSRMMDNANFEVIAMLKNYPILCVFHGEGLIQDWVDKAKLPNAAKHGTPEADLVRTGEILRVAA